MKEYTITMAKATELHKLYSGYNMLWVSTIEVEVEANSEKEAIEMVKGYNKMVAWKVNDKVVWGRG